MDKGDRVRRIANRLAVSPTILAGAIGLTFAGIGPAGAIPSPELVVGSFVSISQLFAIASAILGGGAAYATMRRGGSPNMSRALFSIAVGMFVLLCVSVGLNIYQYVEQKNERQARLEETLVRPARTPGALPGDPEVKELTYAQQTRHPDAMTTAEADRLLQAKARGDRDDMVFLDVRERAEREMGTLKGITFVRYPDFASSGIDLKNKKAVLFCHNGNRSHETCEALKKLGINCQFIVGGVEKWVTEGRAIEGLQTRSLDQLRAIPDYPNRSMLLDTPEVRRLVADERAIFVDARYPVEFNTHGHLPNAINFAIRRVPTAELPKHMEALPKRPIILPCYDRRGCFFAEVLGLELTRAGHDVRGRYTQPWAYYMPTGRPPHVEAWVAENNKSIWLKSADYLAGLMSPLAQWIGVLGIAALLALISRLLVLPFSLKAERDQIRARAVTGELNEIKIRLKDDPVRRTRAIRGFYRRHGMTPVRNLLALLFLPVMAVALMAVQELSVNISVGFLWVPTLGGRDPLLILPLVFGALITLYIDLAFATKRQHRIAIWLIGLPLMTATGALFGAGADIYLIVSATLLLVQRLWVSGQLDRLWQVWRDRLPEGVLSLEDVTELVRHGNKAHRLAQMHAAGMPVPEGLLLTPLYLSKLMTSPAEARERELDVLWRRLGGTRLAVRSCGTNEDGTNQSFAGVFESVIGVNRTELGTAIAKVQASFEAARVSSYLYYNGTGSVLIQRMVDAEYAGVLFTRDPSASGLAMVEMVQGTAQDLVSGVVRPETFRFGRVSHKPFGATPAPIDLAPLLALGAAAERLFGGPQDMEWAYRAGRFHLVQSRDITRGVAGDADAVARQNDLGRALDLAKGTPADEIIFGKNELSEMLPRPTPLSLSLMEALWTAGGSIDHAARRLRLSYPVEEGAIYLVPILGRLYVDKREEKARALAIGSLAARRLLRDAERIEREFRDDFLPRFTSEARLQGVADFEKLSSSELVEEIGRLRDRFVHDTHVEVDIINIAASFYLDRARRALSAAGVDPSSLLGHIPQTIEGRAIDEIAATPAKSRRWLLLKHFGHRAVLDYEPAEPRYAEDLNTLNRMVAGRTQVPRPAYQETPALSKSLARSVDIARRFQTLKEDAKHQTLQELAVLRRALLVLDRRFGLDGRVFYLSFEEVLTLDGQNAAKLRALAASREEQAACLRHMSSLPSALTAHDLEEASAGHTVAAHETPGLIRGTRVSGSKVVEGRARVVGEEDAEHGKPLESFRDGDIIVAAMINPAWLPYFARAGGFVSEVGGWLSHPAILAREYDVAMIVGTDGIAHILEGSMLRLHLDGRIELLTDEYVVGREAAE